MTKLTVACVQMCSSTQREDNFAAASTLIKQAAKQGATYVQTPEMTGTIELDRAKLTETSFHEADDPMTEGFAGLARELGIWLHIGSLAFLTQEARLANRSLVFDPSGRVCARYDKIHMFDVTLPSGKRFSESEGYRPGVSAVTSEAAGMKLGLSICYDLRFSALYRDLTKAGAKVLTAPAAFTRETGEAHWHLLLRARAVECGAFMIAAAQGGLHQAGRETFGHSMIIDPWGKVLVEAGSEPGVIAAEIDLDEVSRVRGRVPGLQNERDWQLTPC